MSLVELMNTVSECLRYQHVEYELDEFSVAL